MSGSGWWLYKSGIFTCLIHKLELREKQRPQAYLQPCVCMHATLAFIPGETSHILVTEQNLGGCDPILAVLQSTEAPTHQSPVSIFP